eukprot:TRINITY_DN5463_c0_g1_i19.p5 TRINITY_DN5463_c0_g1~~TRINITY_DN5463_c0_g1_i19.p5  ORF type:complete len:111 (-),score=5.37 TRINITY_DN5463_c0_g1_i19:93-425(-)
MRAKRARVFNRIRINTNQNCNCISGNKFLIGFFVFADILNYSECLLKETIISAIFLSMQFDYRLQVGNFNKFLHGQFDTVVQSFVAKFYRERIEISEKIHVWFLKLFTGN